MARKLAAASRLDIDVGVWRSGEELHERLFGRRRSVVIARSNDDDCIIVTPRGALRFTAECLRHEFAKSRFRSLERWNARNDGGRANRGELGAEPHDPNGSERDDADEAAVRDDTSGSPHKIACADTLCRTTSCPLCCVRPPTNVTTGANPLDGSRAFSFLIMRAPVVRAKLESRFLSNSFARASSIIPSAFSLRSNAKAWSTLCRI